MSGGQSSPIYLNFIINTTVYRAALRMSRGAAVVRYGEAFQCLRLAVAFGTAPGAPVASWAALPNQFSTPSVNAAASDLATAGDGTSFALQTSTATEIRTSGLSLSATPASAELAQI